MNAVDRYNAIIRIDNSYTWDTDDMTNLIQWYEIDKDSDYKELIPETVFSRIIYLHNRDCIKYDDLSLIVSLKGVNSI